LYIIPAAIPPHKSPTFSPLAADADRLAMCRLTFGGDSRFLISDLELRRGDASYTIDTLRALQNEQPEAAFTLLIGSDLYPEFHLWRDYRALLRLCRLCVTLRNGAPPLENPHLTAAEKRRVRFLDTEPPGISATQIRQALSAGQPAGAYLTPETAKYIEERKLY